MNNENDYIEPIYQKDSIDIFNMGFKSPTIKQELLYQEKLKNIENQRQLEKTREQQKKPEPNLKSLFSFKLK